MLLAAGADPNIQNGEQDTPLYMAVLSNNIECVKVIAEKVSPLLPRAPRAPRASRADGAPRLARTCNSTAPTSRASRRCTTRPARATFRLPRSRPMRRPPPRRASPAAAARPRHGLSGAPAAPGALGRLTRVRGGACSTWWRRASATPKRPTTSALPRVRCRSARPAHLASASRSARRARWPCSRGSIRTVSRLSALPRG
jgi:hypothetical protein